jgi:hypothetical protein
VTWLVAAAIMGCWRGSRSGASGLPCGCRQH